MVLFLHYAQGKLVTEFWRIINRLTKMPYCLVVAVRVRTSVCPSVLSDKSHFSVKTKASPCVGSLNTVYWILSLTVDRKILQFSFKLMLYRVVILLEGGQIRSGGGLLRHGYHPRRKNFCESDMYCIRRCDTDNAISLNLFHYFHKICNLCLQCCQPDTFCKCNSYA